MIIDRWFGAEHRRRRLAVKAPPGPVRDYLCTAFPSAAQDCREVDYVALDLETTGLDPAQSHIVSAGTVRLHGLRIELGSAQHYLVNSSGELPERSVVIHQLTHDALAGGKPLETVMTALLQQLAGKVLLAHFARVEVSFLRAACRRLWNAEIVFPVVCTERLARRRLEQRQQETAARDLRLFNLRKNYNLPAYRAHNALYDALACAELFAAQVAEIGGKDSLPLKRLMAKF
jgi:DNA polymerase-3 subunit epsilon